MSSSNSAPPAGAAAAVLKPSASAPSEDAISVVGPNFDENDGLDARDVRRLLKSYERIGFQATSLAQAIEIVDNMVCYEIWSTYLLMFELHD